MFAEVRICILDGKEVGNSECFFAIANELGLKYANKWTKVIKIPLKKVDDS